MRLLLPLLGGIGLALYLKHYSFDFYSLALLPLGLALAYFFITIVFPFKSYSHRWVSGLLLSITVFIIGFYLVSARYGLNKPNHFSRHASESGFLLIKLLEPPSERANSFRLLSRVEACYVEGEWQSTGGKLMVYLQKDSVVNNLKYGDLIVVPSSFREVQPPSNPNEFNYKAHLEHTGIFHQMYCSSNSWKHSGENSGGLIMKTLFHFRERLLRTLNEHGIEQQEFAVASALLLGFRDALDKELMQAFSGAGAMHILCVSGLHVGILYLVLALSLSFLDKSPRLRYLKVFLVILFIWLYAAITGLAPSVLRASTMFSFIALGKVLGRHTNTYNTLAASALILLAIDPFIITRTGFQLSYLAVLGIVTFQPPMSRLFYFKNTIADYVWGIITVSIAAQLATAPLSIYYFNQFPNYFLITNLIAIPMASIILYSGLAFFLFSFIPYLSNLLSYALAWSIKGLNYGVKGIEGIPGSTSTFVYLSPAEFFLLLMLLLVLSAWVVSSRKKWVFIGLFIFLGVSAFRFEKIWQHNSQEKMVFYNVRQPICLEYMCGRESFMFADSAVVAQPDLIAFQTSGNRIACGVKNTQYINIREDVDEGEKFRFKHGLIQCGSKTVLLLSDFHKHLGVEKPLEVDYVVVNRKSRWKSDVLMQRIKFKMLVLSGDMTPFYINYWKLECEKHGWECWPLAEKGALVVNL